MAISWIWWKKTGNLVTFFNSKYVRHATVCVPCMYRAGSFFAPLQENEEVPSKEIDEVSEEEALQSQILGSSSFFITSLPPS